MRLLRSMYLLYNRQHHFSVAQIEVCRLYDQDQLSAGNAGLLRDFLLNEVEHHKVDIRLAAKAQRTAIGGHIQLSAGFLKIQKADTGDIALVRQRLMVMAAERAAGVLFDARGGQRGILHLCGQIQQLPDLCAFACIVGINGFCPLVSSSFSTLSHRAPRL